MAEESNRESAIFFEALERTSLEERAAYVEQACVGDVNLARRVRALLQAHEGADSVLDNPAVVRLHEPTDVQPGSATHGAGDDAIPFLEPSQQPGSLGRLAHYEMLEVQGRGGFGTVFKAFDEKLRRIVAIKVLAPALAASGTARQRFLREARAAAAVRDDHVIDIYAVEEQPTPYLVMEYVDGPTLQAKLEKDGPLPVREILRIGQQVASGLAAAHRQGLIHRDVKPANILLENGVERVKLSDFGLARAVDDASLSQSGLIAGTPLYMAPEQAEAGPVDHRADLFSLGSVLYAMCVGHPPFRAASTLAVIKRVCTDTPRPIRDLNPDIPEWLTVVIDRLLAKTPADRIASASDVAQVLAKYLADVQMRGLSTSIEAVPAASEPTQIVEQAPQRPEMVEAKRGPRRGMRVALAVGASVVLLASAGWLLRDRWPHSHEAKEPDGKQVHASPLPTGNPLDRRSRKQIPAHLLALANGGDPAPDLVAILTDGRFDLPGDKLGQAAVSPKGRWLAVPCGDRVLLFDARSGQLRNTLEGHKGSIFRCNFSADGSQLASANNDMTVILWDVATAKQIRSFNGHTGQVLNVIFSQDRKRLISGSIDGTVRIWDTESGEELHNLPHEEHVHALALAGDGRTLVTGCNDHKVRLWDLETGEAKLVLEGHTGKVASAQFSVDGKWLATGSDEVILWDAVTFKQVRTLSTPGANLAFGPGTLFTAKAKHAEGEAHVVSRHDPATGKKLPDLILKNQSGWGVFALTPDGKTLFAARTDPNPDRFISVYDAQTGKESSPRRGHLGEVLTVAFSPNGQLLASGDKDGTVRLWDLADWREDDPLPPARLLGQHLQPVQSIRFSPDGKLLASGALDRTICIWDSATGKRQRTLRGHSISPSRIAFSPDGQTIAAGQEDGTIKLWGTASGQERSVLAGHSGEVRCVAYSPDGQLLASASADKKVHVHRVDTEQLVRRLDAPNLLVAVEFSADGKTLVAATDDSKPSSLNVWDVATWRCTSIPSAAEFLSGLSLCPTAPLAATAGSDQRVRLWDLRDATPRLLTLSQGLFGDVAEVSFSPDGRYLAAALAKGIAIHKVPALAPPYQVGKPLELKKLAGMPSVADALDAKAIPADLLAQAGDGDPEKAPAGLVAILGGPDGHEGQVLQVAVSPDGTRLASAGWDKTVRVWDLATGKQLQRLTGHERPAFTVAFSPDGKRLASGGIDGTVRLWDLATSAEVYAPLKHGGEVRQLLFTPDGQTLAVAAADSSIKLWDVETGRPKRTLWSVRDFSACLAISPDGKTLATGHEADTIRLWDIATGWQLATIPTLYTPRCLAFTPDGQSIVGGGRHYLKAWDLATFKPRNEADIDKSQMLTCAIRADGGLVAAAGEADGLLRLWDPAVADSPAREIRLFPADTKYLHGVAFTPDGRYVATANPNGTIYVLKVTAPNP